jgi:phosphatidate cytidylyltransferase
MQKIKNLINRSITALPLIIVYIACVLSKNIFKVCSMGLSIIMIWEYVINIKKFCETKNSKRANFYRTGISMSLFGLIWILPFIYILFNTISRKKFLFLIVLNSFSDSFQYLAGNQFGKRYKMKPFPSISPNKTTIGYILGLSLGFIAGSILLPFTSIQIILILLFGVIGDLLASKIKRILEIKDFSQLLGSHGGFLDRFDSVILSSVMFASIYP